MRNATDGARIEKPDDLCVIVQLKKMTNRAAHDRFQANGFAPRV
jgi:hypothetical protein